MPTSINTPTPTPVPYTVNIWPNMGAPIPDPPDDPFTIDGSELVAQDLNSGTGWTTGGWALPGASYELTDLVYVSGFITCNGDPCLDSNLGINVGGGDANGVIGTAGFRWNVNTPGACVVDNSDPMKITFVCVVYPDRGAGVVFSHIWLGIFHGGAQLRDAHITSFGIDWSGISPTPTATSNGTFTPVAPLTPTPTPTP